VRFAADLTPAGTLGAWVLYETEHSVTKRSLEEAWGTSQRC
jgi:hypothetical protein